MEEINFNQNNPNPYLDNWMARPIKERKVICSRCNGEGKRLVLNNEWEEVEIECPYCVDGYVTIWE